MTDPLGPFEHALAKPCPAGHAPAGVPCWTLAPLSRAVCRRRWAPADLPPPLPPLTVALDREPGTPRDRRRIRRTG